MVSMNATNKQSDKENMWFYITCCKVHTEFDIEKIEVTLLHVFSVWECQANTVNVYL